MAIPSTKSPSDYGSHGQRIMRFLPQRNLIEVRTWNPQVSEFCAGTGIVPDVSQHQFQLDYQMMP